MSVLNDKICCNCKHNIRKEEKRTGKYAGTYSKCYCEIDNCYLGYVQVMEDWCEHWAKEVTK